MADGLSARRYGDARGHEVGGRRPFQGQPEGAESRPEGVSSKDAAYIADVLVRPVAVIGTHVNEGATTAGKLRPIHEPRPFASLVKGQPVCPALSGKTLQFRGDGKCVAR